MLDKLNIANEMKCFDLKDRDFYKSLTEEERKKFSNFLMIRWGSSVNGIADLQHYYLVSTNERLNKHFFSTGKHPELQWLCATTVSPGMGSHWHNWISNKKDTSSNGIKKQLTELFPSYKEDEIELLAKINTKKDVDAYLKKLGQETKK